MVTTLLMEGTGQATAIGTAFSTVQTDALAALTAVAPVAIAIFGAFLVWKLGKKFFSAISK